MHFLGSATKIALIYIVFSAHKVSGMDAPIGYANYGCSGNQKIFAEQSFESFRRDVLNGVKTCDGTLFEDEDADTLRYFSEINYSKDLRRVIVECGDNYKRLEYGFIKSNSRVANKEFEVQLRLDAKGNCVNHNAGVLIN